jgi:choline kinase
MKQDTPVIILAGGFGTRLSTVVKDVPKPMAPINGKPFLALYFQGITTSENKAGRAFRWSFKRSHSGLFSG